MLNLMIDNNSRNGVIDLPFFIGTKLEMFGGTYKVRPTLYLEYVFILKRNSLWPE